MTPSSALVKANPERAPFPFRCTPASSAPGITRGRFAVRSLRP